MDPAPTLQAHTMIVIGGGKKGGIEALGLLLADLPFPIAACILVAIEDPLQTAENMILALQGHTRLIVSIAGDGEELQLGHVYLAGRDRHLMVGPGLVAQLQQGERVHGKRPAADVLFSSAAEHCGSRVIGVILSGDTADGVIGLRSIKASGGQRLAQSPSTAENFGMPLWAALEDSPDFLCSPQEMGPLLGHLIRSDDLT